MVDQYVYYWKYIHVFKIGVTKFFNLHNSSKVFEEKNNNKLSKLK